MDRISCIYCIENIITHKKYIGQTIDNHERWRRHKSELNRNKHYNEHLQNSWNKYGEENFIFYILEECSREELNDREKYYIELYKTMNRKYGFNLISGGGQKSYFSDELRKRIGDTTRGRRHTKECKEKMSGDRKGEKNSFYGKHHTDESKKKMSQYRKGLFAGEKNPRFNPEWVVCIDDGKIYHSAFEASKFYGLYSSGITKCCKGKLKTTGGLRFRYYNEEIDGKNEL